MYLTISSFWFCSAQLAPPKDVGPDPHMELEDKKGTENMEKIASESTNETPKIEEVPKVEAVGETEEFFEAQEHDEAKEPPCVQQRVILERRQEVQHHEPQRGDYNAKVVWQNVFVFVLLHSAFLYGVYLALFEAMWKTWIFGKCINLRRTICSNAQ